MARLFAAALRCPKCTAFLGKPAPHPDGLPGILYKTCNGCGYSRAITTKPRPVRLTANPKRK